MPEMPNIRADVLKASRFYNGIWSTDASGRVLTWQESKKTQYVFA